MAQEIVVISSLTTAIDVPVTVLRYGKLFNRHVDGGRYVVSVTKGVSYTDLPSGLLDLADGQIGATFRLDGHGRVGLAARVNRTADTGYTFWIDGQGRCGASRQADGMITALFVLHCPTAVPTGDNTLSLAARGGHLLFTLNDRPVFSYNDAFPLPSGGWGLYVASSRNQGQVLGHFARITIVGALSAAVQPTLTAGPFHPMIDYDFALGDNYSWGTGRDPHTQAAIGGSSLTIRARDQYTRVVTPLEFPNVADGQIATVVRMQGEGRVGVSARWRVEPDEHFTEYAFWMDNKADVGLTREVDGDRVTVVQLHSAAIRLHQDNEVVLRLQGPWITCFINGQRAVSYLDRHPLAAGAWGAYVADYPGGPFVQGQFARILIAD